MTHLLPILGTARRAGACAAALVLAATLALSLPQATAFAQAPAAQSEAAPEADAAAEPAPDAAPPIGPVELQPAQARLSEAEGNLGRIRRAIDDNRANDLELTNLRLELEELAQAMIDLGLRISPRLNEIRTRLDQIGPVPDEGAPPEPEIVAEERMRLSEERAEINALVGAAEEVSVAANQLADSVTEMRRELFTDTLFNRSVIDRDLFARAGAAFADEIVQFERTISSWLTFTWSFKRGAVLTAVFLSIVAALVFIAGGYRIFGRFVRRDPLAQPAYISRLSVAFWSTVIPTAASVALMLTTYGLLENLNILRADIAPLIQLLMAILVAIHFIWRLALAVLTPSLPNWRLVDVSDRGARTLTLFIFAITIVSSLDYYLSGVSVALGSDVVVTVAKTFVASIVIGVLLIALSFVRPMAVHAPVDGEVVSSRRQDGRWSPYISIPLRVAGAALIVLALTGYVGLARFISTQIIVTGAILVTMYIGFLSGRAVSSTDDFAATSVGRMLARRLRFGPVALDQAGLACGLAIYALVIVLGVPLILLQWGFQIQDIESWAYQLFTEIRVGNISISLLGIFFGILVFILGYFLTRWFQSWIDGNVMARGRLDTGVRNSIRTAVGYAGVAVAGIIGVSAAGIDLSSLALVAGALSLGIGFGLQNIVSNFVSGLILLAERPFKVGDWVVTGTTEGFVKRISVRATEIETFQRQSIIVPNSELINASVGNWTHRNQLGRVDILVGVSYDSDPRRVIEMLYEIARAHELVMRNPEPVVVFTNFGDSSLDFELRVFLNDVLNGLRLRTELRLAIFERFKAEGIHIPYPQRDLNIKIEGEDGRGATAEQVERFKSDPKRMVRTIAAQAAAALDEDAGEKGDESATR